MAHATFISERFGGPGRDMVMNTPTARGSPGLHLTAHSRPEVLTAVVEAHLSPTGRLRAEFQTRPTPGPRVRGVKLFPKSRTHSRRGSKPSPRRAP